MDKKTYNAECRRLDIAAREEAIRASRWARWRAALFTFSVGIGLGLGGLDHTVVSKLVGWFFGT